MGVLIRVAVFLAGALLVLVVLRSLIVKTMMTRSERDPVSFQLSRIIAATARRFVPDRHDYERVDKVLGWYWPITLMSLILLWFLLALSGFAAGYWATGAVNSVFDAFVSSGSALTTLGFAAPPNPPGQILAIIEGGIGLFLIVALFSFIPGYQATIQNRDDQVEWLYARAGNQPTGAALIEWFYRGGLGAQLETIWGDWEKWFRFVGESHAVSTILVFTRSFRKGQSWVNASGAILDAAALALSIVDVKETANIQICLDSGVTALCAIQDALVKLPASRGVTANLTGVTRADFDAARATLAAAGVPLKADCEQGWVDFAALRGQYDQIIVWLTELTMSRPAPWLKPVVDSRDL